MDIRKEFFIKKLLMKFKRIVWVVSTIILLALTMGCNTKQENEPCTVLLFEYGSIEKIYLIHFDGKDSVETICGKPIYRTFLGGYDDWYYNPDTIQFEEIYMKKSIRLSAERKMKLLQSLSELDLENTEDSIPMRWRDADYAFIYFGKRGRNLPIFEIKDQRNLNVIYEMGLSSPIFLNTYSWFWLGPEVEEEMIEEYKSRFHPKYNGIRK